MNKVFKLISVLILMSSLVLISACFNDNDSDKSNESGVKNPDVGADVGEQGYPNMAAKFSFIAAPKITEISLNWSSVEGAVSYQISRKLEGGAAVIENTNDSRFSFTTGESETYEVWIAALDASGDVLEVSSKMNVTTGSSTSLQISDEGI